MGEQLYIPSFIVRAAGFLAGDRAFVAKEESAGSDAGPVCVLSKEKPADALNDCAVSKDCHILVTRAMLKHCGLDAENLEIDGKEGKIIIRQCKPIKEFTAPAGAVRSKE
jgi:hypothetical protein